MKKDALLSSSARRTVIQFLFLGCLVKVGVTCNTWNCGMCSALHPISSNQPYNWNSFLHFLYFVKEKKTFLLPDIFSEFFIDSNCVHCWFYWSFLVLGEILFWFMLDNGCVSEKMEIRFSQLKIDLLHQQNTLFDVFSYIQELRDGTQRHFILKKFFWKVRCSYVVF